MFGISETELVIIVVFAFLLFGPDKLPGMGRTLGRVLRQFREASDGFTEVVQTNIMDPASEELEKSPKQRRREEAAAMDADDEADGGEAKGLEEVAPARRETFAERKARLQAEREAAAERESGESDGTEKDGLLGGPAGEVSGVTDTPDGEPTRTSAQDLYASTTRHSSRFQSHKDESTSSAEDAVAPVETESEKETNSALSTTSGEEEGSLQA